MMILFGDTLEAFVQFELFTNGSCNSTDPHQPFSPLPVLERYGWSMGLAGAVVWLDAYIFVSALNTAAARQVFRIRGQFLKVTRF
jgi:hypothetical protein